MLTTIPVQNVDFLFIVPIGLIALHVAMFLVVLIFGKRWYKTCIEFIKEKFRKVKIKFVKKDSQIDN